MKRFINNILSIIYSLIKFSIIKVFHWKTFKYNAIERFSPDTDIYFLGNGTLKLGKFVRAHSGVRLRVCDNAVLKIDDNVSFNYGCMVTAKKYIHIGEGVQFGPNVLIFDNDHNFRATGGLKANKFKCADITIGANTWIGANTVILKGTSIGENCVVGASCVVNGKYPDNTLIYQKRETTISEIELENLH